MFFPLSIKYTDCTTTMDFFWKAASSETSLQQGMEWHQSPFSSPWYLASDCAEVKTRFSYKNRSFCIIDQGSFKFRPENSWMFHRSEDKHLLPKKKGLQHLMNHRKSHTTTNSSYQVQNMSIIQEKIYCIQYKLAKSLNGENWCFPMN